MHSRRRPPQPPERLRESLAALPHVGAVVENLSPTAALAAFFILRRMHSQLPDHIQAVGGSLLQDAQADIEPLAGTPDAYVLTSAELLSLLNRAAITGAMQTAYAIGSSKLEADVIHELFAQTAEVSGGNDAASDQKPGV